MKKIFIYLNFLILNFSGCLALRQDVYDLHIDMQNLKKELVGKMSDNVNLNIEIKNEIVKELEELRKISADLKDTIDNQNVGINMLGGKVDEGNFRFQDIKFNQDYIENIDKKLSIIEDKLYMLLASTQSVKIEVSSDENKKINNLSDEQIYYMARGDYSRGNYDLAIKGFENIINNFSNSQFFENANYDIIISYYAKKDWNNVCEKSDIFINKFNDSEFLSKVYNIKAKALKKQGNFKKSKEIYNKIIKDFSYTEEAKIAKDELDKMV